MGNIIHKFLVPYMPWQIKSKTLFLTYPQSGAVTKEELLKHLLALLDDVKFARIAEEHHKDGGLHLHAVVVLGTPVRSRNERFFDYLGLHPNIQSCRNISKSLEYISKESAYIDHGETSSFIKKNWTDVRACTSEESMMNTIAEISFRDYVLHHDRISSFCSKRFKREMTYTGRDFSEFDTALFPELSVWLEQINEGML